MEGSGSSGSCGTGHCLRVEDPAARTAHQEQQPPAPRQVKLLHHAHRLRLKGIVSPDEYFFLRSKNSKQYFLMGAYGFPIFSFFVKEIQNEVYA
jgi:hypothetical protein